MKVISTAAQVVAELTSEIDGMRSDIRGEIVYSNDVLATLDAALRLELEEIDREAERRKADARNLFRQLADNERGRITLAERRLAKLNSDDLSMAGHNSAHASADEASASGGDAEVVSLPKKKQTTQANQ